MKKIQIIFSCLIALGFLAFINNASAATCSGTCMPIEACGSLKGTADSGGTCDGGFEICCVISSPALSPAIPPAGQTTTPPAATPPAASGAAADSSCPAGTAIGTICFSNPIRCDTMSCFFGNILNALLGVVAFIALIFIIIGAVMYMLSAGDEQAMERAKKTITAAVAGFAIAAAAPTFLRTIKDILGGASGADADAMLNQAYTLKDIAIKVLNFLLSVTGIIAIIGLIIGAIFYLTSYGDEDRMGKGKKILVASIIGIVIAFASLVIVKQVASLIAAQ